MLTSFGIWRRRRAFRTATLANIQVVFAGIPDPDFHSFAAHYPTLRQLIDTHFADGFTTERSATHVLIAMLPHYLEHSISAKRRENIFAEIVNFTSHQATPDDWLTFLIIKFNIEATDWLTAGKLEETELRIGLSEVMGALKGYSMDERREDRFVKYAMEAIGRTLPQ